MNETPNETFETLSNKTDVMLVDGVAVADGPPVAQPEASNTADELIEPGPEMVFVPGPRRHESGAKSSGWSLVAMAVWTVASIAVMEFVWWLSPSE